MLFHVLSCICQTCNIEWFPNFWSMLCHSQTYAIQCVVNYFVLCLSSIVSSAWTMLVVDEEMYVSTTKYLTVCWSRLDAYMYILLFCQREQPCHIHIPHYRKWNMLETFKYCQTCAIPTFIHWYIIQETTWLDNFSFMSDS